MGYSAYINKQEFFISKDRLWDAGVALHNKMSKMGSLERIPAWLDRGDISDARKTKILHELTILWRWRLVFDGMTGDVNKIEFESSDGKLGDEDILFNTIAPFVGEGSYIEMVGEDGEMWRWVFDGNTMKHVKPIITWDEK